MDLAIHGKAWWSEPVTSWQMLTLTDVVYDGLDDGVSLRT